MGFVSLVNTAGSAIDLDTINAYFAGMPGMGMPPVENVAVPYGTADGALYQRTVVRPRIMTLIVEANTQSGATYTSLHTARRSLIDLIKPDRSATQQPVVVRYTNNGVTLEIDAYYDGGLEYGDLVGFSERIAVRFVSYDPYWRKTSDTSASAATQTTLASVNSIAERSTAGVWANLGGGINIGAVYALLYDSSGNLYAGGAFTSIGGVAANNIAKWNGSAWSALGTGADSTVQALALAPNGDIYVGGAFGSAGGVANTAGIAKVTSSGTWSALGSSTGTAGGGGVTALTVDPVGTLWITGGFTSVHGVAATNVASRNTAGTWAALGTGLSSMGLAIVAPDSTGPYVGGGFTTANGVTVNRIAKWTGATFVAYGAGANGEVNALAAGPDGSIYAGGVFTAIGGVSAARVARLKSGAFTPLGTGVGGGDVYTLAVLSDNTLWAGGFFTSAGGLTLPDGFARWQSGTWLPPDIDMPGTAQGRVLAVSSTGKLAIGTQYGTSGSAAAAGITTITNAGTATAWPVITITGPTVGAAYLYQIANYTTGDAIYFSNLIINAGETYTLDLRPGYKTFTSSWRGNLYYALLPGSNEMTWRLLPGANSISIYTSNSTCTATIAYRERYWSTDGVG